MEPFYRWPISLATLPFRCRSAHTAVLTAATSTGKGCAGWRTLEQSRSVNGRPDFAHGGAGGVYASSARSSNSEVASGFVCRPNDLPCVNIARPALFYRQETAGVGTMRHSLRRSIMVRTALFSADLLSGGSKARGGGRPVHRQPSIVITAMAPRSSRLNCTKSLMTVAAMLSQFVAFCRFEGSVGT